MNIIWLTTEVPYPAVGGRNGSYHRIVEVGKSHSIYLFSISYNETEEKLALVEMQKSCKKVNFYNRSRMKLRTFWKQLLMPHCVASRDNPNMKRDLVRCADENNIDIIIMDFPHMALNLIPLHRKYKNIPITVQQHNIEYLTMRNVSKISHMCFLKKTIWFIESIRLEIFEKLLYHTKLISSYTFFSIKDKEYFEEKLNFKNKSLSVIPLGADEHHSLNESNNLSANCSNILFVGKMSSEVNISAAVWFVTLVLPLIKKSIPNARLYIAGADPDKEIKKLNCQEIIVTGGFKSPDEIYNISNLVVIPVFYGGGVKGKLLEAISYKKPVVTTSHGIRGTLFQDQVHLILADNPEKFAQACIQVLNTNSSYNDMASRAYDLFRDKYAWNIIGKQYCSYLESLVNHVNL